MKVWSNRTSIAVMLGLAASTACLAAQTINVTSRGCVESDLNYHCGGDPAANGNFYTGMYGGDHTEGRSFFVFDLTGVSGPITTASIQLQMPPAGYGSSDPSETFAIFDYLLSPTGLQSAPITAGGFADLGTGTQFGSVNLTPASQGTVVVINLNAAGITAITNALGGKFAVGGAVTTLSGQTANDEAVFGSTLNTATVQLVLNPPLPGTPVPPSVMLVGIGLVALAGWQLSRLQKPSAA